MIESDCRRRLRGGGSAAAPARRGGVEVANVVRRYAARGEISGERGPEALDDLADFPMHRHPHVSLLHRIWGLRHNLSAYDASYVALAEALDAPLVTRDRRLAAASGHRARIELI